MRHVVLRTGSIMQIPANIGHDFEDEDEALGEGYDSNATYRRD
jgi:hypothetical protein